MGMAIAVAMTAALSARAPVAASTLAGVPTPEGEAAATEWIEARDGDLPIILSVPHGGELRPDGIPDRHAAVVLNDPGSMEFALELAQALADLTGRQPYVVINHLARTKLDPNRSLSLGAQHNPSAAAAWKAYHNAIDRAERLVTHACGWGAYFDLHSNGRPTPRVEFGYGLTVVDLDQPDEVLDGRRLVLQSNLRSLATWGAEDQSELLRGPESLGGRLEAHGYSVAPSPKNPVPQADYFDGGLSVVLHGTQSGGSVDGVQIEVPYSLLDDARRSILVRLMAEAIVGWMDQAYGFGLASHGPICSGFADVRLDDPGSVAVATLAQVGGLPACGQSPRKLCPSEPLSRAEAAEAVWRLIDRAGAPPVTDEGSAYADLPTDPAKRVAIEALSRRGLLQACAVEPVKYCPEQPETRAEAAFIGMRLLGGTSYVPPPPTGLFADLPTGRWSAWWLEAAFHSGLIGGCGKAAPRGICPQGAISRVDFATLVVTALARRAP